MGDLTAFALQARGLNRDGIVNWGLPIVAINGSPWGNRRPLFGPSLEIRPRHSVGLSSSAMSWFVIAMQVGMWFGYISFGYIADAIGRKRAYVTFVATAAALLPIYGVLREPWRLLLLGPAVAFFGTGYYSGFGAVIAEWYPTTVRATAAGVGYNVGRIASAAAPFVVGSVAGTQGFGVAFAITGGAFLLAAVAWIGIPDTKNRELTA